MTNSEMLRLMLLSAAQNMENSPDFNKVIEGIAIDYWSNNTDIPSEKITFVFNKTLSRSPNKIQLFRSLLRALCKTGIRRNILKDILLESSNTLAKHNNLSLKEYANEAYNAVSFCSNNLQSDVVSILNDLGIPFEVPPDTTSIETTKRDFGGGTPWSDRSSNDIVVFQISDIHAGSLGNLFYEDFLTVMLKLSHTSRPDILAVTGDLTSVSSEEEFKQFRRFLNQVRDIWLSSEYSASIDCPRIVIVPGNHDNVWSPDNLDTDRLELFHKFIAIQGGEDVFTPWGIRGEGRDCKSFICRTNKEQDSEIPFAVGYYKSMGLIVAAITTSMYSGEIEYEKDKHIIEAICDVLLKPGLSDIDTLRNLISVDTGIISDEYIRDVIKTCQTLQECIGTKKYTTSSKVVLCHHPLRSSANHNISCQLGQRLLIELRELGFTLVLHGHIHTWDEYSDSEEHKADSVACASLSAKNQDTGHGFNIIQFKLGEKPLIWKWPRGNYGYRSESICRL